MECRAVLCVMTLAAMLAGWSDRAHAVIAAKTPMSLIYATSPQVLVAKVTGIQGNVIEATVVETVKGKPQEGGIQVQIQQPEALLRQVAEGQSLVVMVSRTRVAAIHIADTWLLSQPIPSKPAAWRAVQENTDLRQAFPGRTVALLRLINELKAGKPGLLDKVDEMAFTGGIRELGKLDVNKPTFLAAADVDGNGSQDLLVGTASGVRLFVRSGEQYKDETGTWGLNATAGSRAAFGDVNGDRRPDLVMGGSLWMNQSTKFAAVKTAALPADDQVLALAVTDINADSQADIAVLQKNGQFSALANPGSADRAWAVHMQRRLWKDQPPTAPIAAFFGNYGDTPDPHVIVVRQEGITRYAISNDTILPAADFLRLVGQPLETFARTNPPLKDMSAGPIDINGDGQMDLLVAGDDRGIILINRGFGAFFASLAAATPLTSHQRAPFSLSSAVWTACGVRDDRYTDLLVLTADGRLYQAANPPHANKP